MYKLVCWQLKSCLQYHITTLELQDSHTCNLSSLAMWSCGSVRNSSVKRKHSPTFSGETNSTATLMHDWTNRRCIINCLRSTYNLIDVWKTSDFVFQSKNISHWPSYIFLLRGCVNYPRKSKHERNYLFVILSYLQVSHLMWTTCGNKYRISKFLDKCPRFNSC